MAIICWGNLAKTADETTRIEQSIEEYVQRHDENVNAHMGEDYALGAHRLQTALDHPYNSIRHFHVYDIHAEAITAGGMVVRGGGPYISVLDSEDNERVKIYPEGIMVKKGKISVENDGNEEIIDGRGIVGGNIFYSGLSIKSNNETIPDVDKWYPIGDLEFGVYFKRNSPVLVFGNLGITSDFDWSAGKVILEYPTGYFPSFDSDLIGWSFSMPSVGSSERNSMSFVHLIYLYAGYNTVRLLTQMTADDYPVEFLGEGKSTLGYVVLGNV